MNSEKAATNISSPQKINLFLERYAVLLVFIFMCAFLSIFSKDFLQPANLRNVMIQIAINALIGVGMTFVILIGGIDISVGSVVGLAGIVVAVLIKVIPNPSIFVSVLVSIGTGLVVGAICGGINAFAISKFKIPPFIATLGMMSIARGLAFLYTQSRPIFQIPTSFNWIGNGYLGQVPVIVIIMAIVIIAAHIVLDKTVFGRYIYAVGSNPTVAELSGINVKKITYLVYIICAVLSAFAGICLASKLSSGQPSAGTSYELFAIAAVVMGGTRMSGGKGNMMNTVLGLVTIGIINNGLNLLNVSSYWQGILMGVIILTFVAFEQKNGNKK